MQLLPVVRHGHRVGLPALDGREQLWEEVLNTDAEAYGGSGVGNSRPVKAEATGWNGQPRSAELVLPARNRLAPPGLRV
ncbi:alpha amylase C-terminal domain-containing protein [Kitasatospora aburaviensis]